MSGLTVRQRPQARMRQEQRLTSHPAKEAWPELNWPDWQETGDTLHRWTQIVGKVRMALSPMLNHWWQVALYLSSRGLTTSPIPYGAGRSMSRSIFSTMLF